MPTVAERHDPQLPSVPDTSTKTESSTPVHLADLSPIEAKVQHQLVRTLVHVSDTLNESFDLSEALSGLIEACEQLFQGAEASIILTSSDGSLEVVAASTERKQVLEEYQIEQGEGPSLTALRTGQEGAFQDVDASGYPWPAVAQLARAMGYAIVRSVPLRRQDETIGVLSVAHTAEVECSPMHEALLRALADTTAIGVINHRIYAASSELSQQLQTALTTRILIEQSKGAVAARLGITVDEAFEMIRAYARGNNRKLNDIAQSLLDGSLATHELWRTRRVRNGSAQPRP